MGDVIDDRPLILVAEDNASNYLLIEILLKHTYRLIHAQNGREAVAFFQSHHPQLILIGRYSHYRRNGLCFHRR